MKRVLLFVVAVFGLQTFSHAQMEQGNWIIGVTSNILGNGNGITLFNPTTAGFSTTSYKVKSGDNEFDGESRTSINLSPNAAYFVMDNLAIGAGLGFDYTKFEDDDDATTLIGLSPFARYYFNLENIKPFVQLGGGFGSWSYGDDDDEKETVVHIGIGGGIALFVNEKLSIDIGLGYTSESYKVKDDDDTKYIYNSFGIGAGVTLFL